MSDYMTPTEAAHIGKARALGRGCGYAHAVHVARHGLDRDVTPGSDVSVAVTEMMPADLTQPEQLAFAEGFVQGMEEHKEELQVSAGEYLLRHLRNSIGIDA